MRGPNDKRAEHLNLLRQVPLFKGLTDKELVELASLERERRYAKNEIIFFESQPGQAFYYVKEGLVKIYKLSPDGKEQILSVWGPGELFGAVTLLDQGGYPANAEALTELRAGAFYAYEFKRFMDAHGDLRGLVMQEVANRLRSAHNRIRDLALRDVKSRLAGILINTAERHGVDLGDSIKFELELTHQQLGNLVGASRETITRALNDLKDSGALEAQDSGEYLLHRQKMSENL